MSEMVEKQREEIKDLARNNVELIATVQRLEQELREALARIAELEQRVGDA